MKIQYDEQSTILELVVYYAFMRLRCLLNRNLDKKIPRKKIIFQGSTKIKTVLSAHSVSFT